MSKNNLNVFFKDNTTYLRLADSKDHDFIYGLIKDFLQTDLSVTVLELPSFDEFFKLEITRYVITNGVNLFGFVQILKNNEVGYFVDKKYQSKGMGTEAVDILMKLNPRKRYFATINDKNESSKKLILKLGFSPKATIYEKIEE